MSFYDLNTAHNGPVVESIASLFVQTRKERGVRQARSVEGKSGAS